MGCAVEWSVPVLMYHGICRVEGPLRDLAVPPPRLAEQLAALTSAGYRLTGMTDALNRLATGPGEPMVVLTFDDGYANFLSSALPALREVDAGATLYVSTGHLGGTAGWLGSHAARFGPLLTWDELGRVAEAGIEIGNHSLLHHPLDVLPAAQVAREIIASREQLAHRLGVTVPSFAYPHGYHSARVRTAVLRAGHDNACEVGRRIYRAGDDRLAIPRLQATGDHTGAELLRLVQRGEGLVGPAAKRMARPGWRVVRRVAERFGRKLT